MTLQEGHQSQAAVLGGSPEWSQMSGSLKLERQLVGMQVPAVQLPFTLEGSVSLAELGRRRSLVVFFYPGVTAYASGEEDVDIGTVRAWAWRDHEAELEVMGYMVVGVSSQSPRTQTLFASDELLGYMLLSDSGLELAEELGLPTMSVAGERVYEPLTLVVRDRRIARVFHPVDPARDAESVTDWIGRIHI